MLPPSSGGETSGWRQHGLQKRVYPTTTLHGVTTQKTSLPFPIFIKKNASANSVPSWMFTELGLKTRITPILILCVKMFFYPILRLEVAN
jgi:hypothetical protein